MREVNGCVWRVCQGCHVQIQVHGDQRGFRRDYLQERGVGQSQPLERCVSGRLQASYDDLLVDFDQ